jgi:hypothetical protein
VARTGPVNDVRPQSWVQNTFGSSKYRARRAVFDDFRSHENHLWRLVEHGRRYFHPSFSRKPWGSGKAHFMVVIIQIGEKIIPLSGHLPHGTYGARGGLMRRACRRNRPCAGLGLSSNWVWSASTQYMHSQDAYMFISFTCIPIRRVSMRVTVWESVTKLFLLW